MPTPTVTANPPAHAFVAGPTSPQPATVGRPGATFAQQLQRQTVPHPPAQASRTAPPAQDDDGLAQTAPPGDKPGPGHTGLARAMARQTPAAAGGTAAKAARTVPPEPVDGKASRTLPPEAVEDKDFRTLPPQAVEPKDVQTLPPQAAAPDVAEAAVLAAPDLQPGQAALARAQQGLIMDAATPPAQDGSPAAQALPAGLPGPPGGATSNMRSATGKGSRTDRAGLLVAGSTQGPAQGDMQAAGEATTAATRPPSQRSAEDSLTRYGPIEAPQIMLPSVTPAARGGDAAATAATATAAEATLAPQVDSPQFAPALGAQLRLWVRDGVQEARLHLHPAEMGPIAIDIAVQGQSAHIEFHAAVAGTRAALEAALPALASALQDAGYTLSGGGVFQQSAPSAQQDPQRGRDEAANPGSADPSADKPDARLTMPAGSITPIQRGLIDLVA